MALPDRRRSLEEREAALGAVYRYGWDREDRQNRAGKNPNHPMSPHQVAEARAWGDGAAKALRLQPDPPSPPYPPGTPA